MKMTIQIFKKLVAAIVILTLSIPLSMQAQNDAISKYFDQYVDDDNFTVVYITPKMFQMISKLDLKDKDARDIKEVLQDLKGLRILTTEKNGLQYYKEAISKFKTNEYELLMTVRDKDENIRFWTKESGGIISELLMLVGGTKEFVMISFIGNIDLDKISKLANKMNVDGMEHLDQLKDKKN